MTNKAPMKRLVLATAFIATLAQPSMAAGVDGCVAGDSQHNNTVLLKLHAAFPVTRAASEQIRINAVRDPSEKNRDELIKVRQLLIGLLEIYEECKKILAAGEPT